MGSLHVEKQKHLRSIPGGAGLTSSAGNQLPIGQLSDLTTILAYLFRIRCYRGLYAGIYELPSTLPDLLLFSGKPKNGSYCRPSPVACAIVHVNAPFASQLNHPNRWVEDMQSDNMQCLHRPLSISHLVAVEAARITYLRSYQRSILLSAHHLRGGGDEGACRNMRCRDN